MQQEKQNNIQISDIDAAKLKNLALKYKILYETFSQSLPLDDNKEFYILSTKWLNQWKQYVSYDEIVADKSPSEYFGRITLERINNDLQDDVKINFKYYPLSRHPWNTFMKQGLQQNVDYVVIQKEIWEFFTSYYAGIPIIRQLYDNGKDKQAAVNLLRFKSVLLYPSIIKQISFDQIQRQTFESEVMQVDRNMKFKDYQTLIQRTVITFSGNFAKDNNVRIWRYVTDQKDQYKALFNEIRNQVSELEAQDEMCFDFNGELLTHQQYDSIKDIDIVDTNLIVFEFKDDLKPWCIRNQAVLREGKCENCSAYKVLSFPCICKKVAYCTEECKYKDYNQHSSKCEKYGSDDESVKYLTLTQTSLKGIVGLSNLGNTSYFNSGTQCISNSYPLVEYFLKNLYFDEINIENPIGTHGKLVKKLGSLIKKMWCGDRKTIMPTNYKRAVEQFQPKFLGYHKHDSSELITFVLDGIHEDVNRVKKKPQVETKDYDGRPDFIIAKESWLNHLARNQSIIVDLINGLQKFTQKCPTCHRVSITFQPYLIVELDIPTQKNINVTLYDCLQYSQMPQQLDEENTWYCKICKEHVQAFQSVQIYKAPQLLIFTLKRFKANNRLFQQKIQTLVDFPINNLDMTDYVINSNTPNEFQQENENNNGEINKKKVIYDLYAISNHFGGQGVGHYTTYAKNKFTNNWYDFNDSIINQIMESSVVSEAAYVLCYLLRTDESKNCQEKQ